MTRPFEPRAGLPALIALALLSTVGCVSPPLSPTDVQPLPEARAVEVLDEEYLPFRVSPHNRYAIVMKGRRFTPPKGHYRVSTPDDVLKGKAIDDPWVQGDTEQLELLLRSKGYDVYQLDYGQVTPRAMRGLFERLAYVANDDTHLFVAYSGEGDATGWRTRTMTIAENRHVAPPHVTVTPEALYEGLAPIRGKKALLINACEAGVFTEAAARAPSYTGVVIAACGKGYATTPHEPSGTTAIVAAFLDLYADEPSRELNLATAEIDRAGGLWTNMAHHWQELWGAGGLPISYEPAIYVSGDFWL